MKNISWTHKCEDGVKREVRVHVTHASIKWQFKRRDEEKWDYDTPATAEDWDALEEVIERRNARGRQFKLKEYVQKLRRNANV